MSSSIELDGDFVEQWLERRKTQGDLDQQILALVDEHRNGNDVDEAGLLKSLIALAEEWEDADESD